MTQSDVQYDTRAQNRSEDSDVVGHVAAHALALSLVPIGDSVPSPEVASEEDLARLERTADQAMVAACDSIAVTTTDISQHAADARLVRLAADQQQAEEIADCAAQAASAIQLSNEATAQRTAWEASQIARSLADHTLPGDEFAAETAARHTADLVAHTAKVRAAEQHLAADRAARDVAATTEEVVEAVTMVDLATRLGASSRESALGGIALSTAVQQAINAADRVLLT